jgi:hypothetical protein
MTMEPRTASISARELQDRFNAGGFIDRWERNELTAEYISNGHPSPPKADEPVCTRSQEIALRNTRGRVVAIFHQYLRKDNSIGASGMPDPKMVLDRGVEYYLDQPT